MIEVITYKSPEAIRQLEILDEFMASLDADRLLSTNDLYEAAKLYAPEPDVVLTESEQKAFDEIDVNNTDDTPSTILGNVTDVMTIGGKVPSVLPFAETITIQLPKRSHEKAKQRLVKMLACAAGLITVVMGVRIVEPMLTETRAASADKSSTQVDANIIPVSTASTEVEVSKLQIENNSTGSITEETVPTATAETVQVEAITTESINTPQSTVAETISAELTLNQKIASGEGLLSDNKGMPIGSLRLDKYCDTVNVYINNVIDYKNPDVLPYLSLEAQDKAAQIMAGGLSKDQRLIFEDDIMQSGLINGSGDPLYAASPDTTLEEGCVPVASNPRVNQPAYGSTAVDNAGGTADQYQPTAVLSEFGSIPGQGKVTYISGHRSSQSASFNGLVHYEHGDTVSYSVDGQTVLYRMVSMQKVNANIPLPDLIKYIEASKPGTDQLVAQVCIEGQSDSRSIYIFEKA